MKPGGGVVSDVNPMKNNSNTFSQWAFKTFVETAPVLCLAADRQYITQYVNPYYRQIHQVTLAQAVGKHIKEIIGEEGFNDNLPYYEKTLRGEVVERRGSFNKLDGTIHHYHATYAPIYDEEGQVVGLTGLVRDMTASVEIEYANQKLMKLNKEFEQAQQELSRQASLDPLTELHNRRYFGHISERIFNIAVRHGRPLSVVLLDIDDFKMVNDTFGHKIGDQVLVDLASTLRNTVRRSDVVCRYGGEEFIVLLPDTTQADAAKLAEHLRVRIAKSGISLQETELYYSVSLGVASMPFGEAQREPDCIEQVINWADKALYEAKAAGKNRVKIAH